MVDDGDDDDDDDTRIVSATKTSTTSSRLVPTKYWCSGEWSANWAWVTKKSTITHANRLHDGDDPPVDTDVGVLTDPAAPLVVVLCVLLLVVVVVLLPLLGLLDDDDVVVVESKPGSTQHAAAVPPQLLNCSGFSSSPQQSPPSQLQPQLLLLLLHLPSPTLSSPLPHVPLHLAVVDVIAAVLAVVVLELSRLNVGSKQHTSAVPPQLLNCNAFCSIPQQSPPSQLHAQLLLLLLHRVSPTLSGLPHSPVHVSFIHVVAAPDVVVATVCCVNVGSLQQAAELPPQLENWSGSLPSAQQSPPSQSHPQTLLPLLQRPLPARSNRTHEV